MWLDTILPALLAPLAVFALMALTMFAFALASAGALLAVSLVLDAGLAAVRLASRGRRAVRLAACAVVEAEGAVDSPDASA